MAAPFSLSRYRQHRFCPKHLQLPDFPWWRTSAPLTQKITVFGDVGGVVGDAPPGHGIPSGAFRGLREQGGSRRPMTWVSVHVRGAIHVVDGRRPC